MKRLVKKIALLGDGAVGKTSLIARYVHNAFDESYIQTIGTRVSKKEVVVETIEDRVSVNLIIWDILGQKEYRGVHFNAFKGVEGAIMVCDITRKETLDSLEEYWLPSLKKVTGEIPLIFFANKADLITERKFDFADLQKIANENLHSGAGGKLKNAFLTSAKTGDNVEVGFKHMVAFLMLLEDEEKGDARSFIIDSLLRSIEAMEVDTSTLYGALDAIMVDFTTSFGNESQAMDLLREAFKEANLTLKEPTFVGVEKLIYALSRKERTAGMPEDVVKANLEKRFLILNKAKNPGNP
ncbi:MAG: Rab family GTPase [Thermoplasmata archaeon]